MYSATPGRQYTHYTKPLAILSIEYGDLCAMHCHLDNTCSFYLYANNICYLGKCSLTPDNNVDVQVSTAFLYLKKGTVIDFC